MLNRRRMTTRDPKRLTIGRIGMSARRRAFTLLEMVISVGLLVIVMSSMYVFYGESIEQCQEGRIQSQKVQLARVILDRIADEIRNATGYADGYGPGLFGSANEISINAPVLTPKDLMRVQSITDKKVNPQFDLNQINYYIAWDEEYPDDDGNPVPLGLVRRVTQTFNQVTIIEDENVSADEVTAVKEELYAPEIKYIRFRYYDGAKWWDDWTLGGGNTLPQMVQIMIGYDPILPEEYRNFGSESEEELLMDDEEIESLYGKRYSTIVRLVQADVFYGSRMQREAQSLAELSMEESGEDTEY